MQVPRHQVFKDHKWPTIVLFNLLTAGSASGPIPLAALARQTDSTWAVRFVPPRQEVVTVRLAVDGVVASQQSLTVQGRSPTALDLTSSLQQAVLTSQAAAVTAPAINGSNLAAYTGEASFLSVPVLDKAGSL